MMISIMEHLGTNKFQCLMEELTLLELERKIPSTRYHKLMVNIVKRHGISEKKAEDIVDNDVSAAIRADGNTVCCCMELPSAVKITYKDDINDRTIHRLKWNHQIHILLCIWTCECSLMLDTGAHMELLVAREGIHDRKNKCIAKFHA